ncbi:2-phosphoglycerate kinase [Thermoplasma sp. Kam2015]|uniref:mevalonate-3-phosphate 5-kinase n=1 Tax=Thermoplasma sp. Kam2015 TaxID=2094122 RepID=UPI000D8D4ED3|nr:mevalonate-3-phosphate 5-kinase [Thermoplasma sp. Kam2015]PYB68502.1 2-phosphoglycerate kinase [Thermoplasma sp. Kam2015]
MDSRILFIGGVPGVGKTSISGSIAREFGINIMLSGDYLREFLRPLMKSEQLIQKSVYDAWQPYGTMSQENIIRGYRDQAGLMMTGIEWMLRRAISNGEDLIVESLYFLPEMIPADVMGGIRMIYLYIEDEETHRKRLVERINYTHRNSPGTRLASHLYEYRTIMRYSIEKSSGYPVYMVDTSNYQAAKEEIIKKLKEDGF